MTARERISQFDGLRACAFMAVFLHHSVHAPLLWMGVDQFFVLSGFLITRNLLEMKAANTVQSSISTFYFRRVLRIFPPYYVVLALILIITPIASAELPWFFGFMSNVRDAIHNRPIEGPLNPMWSIAVEEQFYVIWPFLVLFLERRALVVALLALIVAAPVFRVAFSGAGFNAVYRLMPCRMDLLACGALLAIVDARDSRWFAVNRRLFLAAAFFAVAIFAALSLRLPTFRTSRNDLMFDVVGFALSTVFFTAILGFVRGSSDGVVARILNHPWIQYVGQISYMAYLTHMLAIVIVRRAKLPMLPTAAVALLLTVALSSASWYLMERPLQRFRGLVRPRLAPEPT